ncbi:hypothetical protein MIMGU_mgv1a023374mg [Erythranthe guttata]|uniref:Glutamate receptor n=1 Tax=Erythranthe guttata TaxID=4155 RepID=A0A022PY24_ERYGU|nr:hypothetical protein MIMGU_mgv1a023374mg [Erythranthe guttata]
MHVFISLSLLSLFLSLCNSQRNTTFQVGVILDANSTNGRIGNTSLLSALSDFYSSHANYSTRIVLHPRDSGGRVTGAATSAINLLKDVQVDAIIGPQTSTQAYFVIGLGNAANVPVVSFSATTPTYYPKDSYFVQTAINDGAQVDAIAAIIKYFKWSQVVLIYEDSDYGIGITPYLSNAFQQVNARVSYRSVIPISATDDFILQELYKMKTMQTRVFVVHTTSGLASRIFLKAKEAEMMSEGYVWIVTTGLMNLFYSLDSNIVESMQGVLGVRPLVPDINPEMNLYGLWAYDTLWALAMAVEKIGFRESSYLQNTSVSNSSYMFITGKSQTGPQLLAAMNETNFTGLSGKFHLVNGKLESSSFQILNINGKKLREVGIWTPLLQNSSQTNANATGLSGEKLEIIIWPGESRNVPKGWEVPVSGKKLRVGIPAVAGFPEYIKVETDPKTNSTKISGLYIDLFDSVMAALPYAVRYEYVPFVNSDGSSAGNYDDLSREVQNGSFDAAVGDITITEMRSEYVDFTLPIEDGGVTITQNVFNEDNNGAGIFLEPLEGKLWLTAIALFIFTGLSLWILEHRFNEAFRGPPSEHVGLIVYIPFMSLVFANREKIVSNLARLVLVVWVFVVLILTSTYTANLSSILTVPKPVNATITVAMLVENKDNVGCREGSFIIQYLIGLGFDDSKIIRYRTSDEFDNALSNGSIKALLSRTSYTNLFLSKYCNKYARVDTTYDTEGIAFLFPKGSPLVADVSRAIVKLTDDQKLTEIRGRWIKESTCKDTSEDHSTQISLKSFAILFGVTGGITGICLVLLLASYLYNNRDFIRRVISNSGTTTWSKVRAISKHFDQRDPKAFRSKEDGENQDRCCSSTVVSVTSDQETASDNGDLSPNSDHITAAAHQPRYCPDICNINKNSISKILPPGTSIVCMPTSYSTSESIQVMEDHWISPFGFQFQSLCKQTEVQCGIASGSHNSKSTT